MSEIDTEADAIKARAERLVLEATVYAGLTNGDNATAAADLMIAFVLLSMRSGAKPERAIEAMGNHAIAACTSFWGEDGRRLDA